MQSIASSWGRGTSTMHYENFNCENPSLYRQLRFNWLFNPDTTINQQWLYLRRLHWSAVRDNTHDGPEAKRLLEPTGTPTLVTNFFYSKQKSVLITPQRYVSVGINTGGISVPIMFPARSFRQSTFHLLTRMCYIPKPFRGRPITMLTLPTRTDSDDLTLVYLFDQPKGAFKALSLSHTGTFRHPNLTNPAAFNELALAELLTERILRAPLRVLCGVIDLAEMPILIGCTIICACKDPGYTIRSHWMTWTWSDPIPVFEDLFWWLDNNQRLGPRRPKN